MLEMDKELVLHQNPKWNSSIVGCLVSLVSVIFTQLTLSLLPLFLPTLPFISLLPLSAVLLVIVMGLGRFCKRVAGVRASAPAYVFFSIIFIWAIYIYVVRQVMSSLLDIVFNTEIIMVIVGLCSRPIILSMYCLTAYYWLQYSFVGSGFVAHHHSSCDDLSVQSPLHDIEALEEKSKVLTTVVHQELLAELVYTRHRRVRYCRHCKNYVMGFDHHCPAFGNCIGQRNHALFLVLLVGFAISEASYVVSAFQFTAKFQISKEVGEEALTSRKLVLGTMLFCLIQVLWQVVFVMWHVYCACFNIKTDEWINWKKYPEFQMKPISDTGDPQNGIQFINPYDKGILRNMKEFLSAKG